MVEDKAEKLMRLNPETLSGYMTVLYNTSVNRIDPDHHYSSMPHLSWALLLDNDEARSWPQRNNVQDHYWLLDEI